MKKNIAIITVIIMCISFTSCTTQNKSKANDVKAKNVQSETTSTQTKKADFDFARTVDYIYINVPDLYKGADLVIVGSYVKHKSTYVTENSMIATKSEFNVKEIKKGRFIDKQIVIDYYGGRMPICEYIKMLDKKTLKETVYDKLTEAEKKEKTIEMTGMEPLAKPNKTSDYLIFLRFSKEKNMYLVISDGYGMREIKDGKAFNFGTKAFEEIKFE